MKDSEKIRGNKIFNILEQLKKNHTIFNIYVTGTDFDGLSIILGVSGGENPRFLIDYPGRNDFDSPLSPGKKCYFEFSGENNIKYSFKATVESIFGKRIKFRFPEFIERSQRRNAFRILASSGSKLLFLNNDDQIEFDIIDVSEGGLLVSLRHKSPRNNTLFKGNTLEKLLLSAEKGDNLLQINIGSAEIVRIDKIDERGRIRYGLKFIGIDKREQDELRRYIYHCQRKRLQKRGGLDV